MNKHNRRCPRKKRRGKGRHFLNKKRMEIQDLRESDKYKNKQRQSNVYNRRTQRRTLKQANSKH